jgi:hypothetical protein
MSCFHKNASPSFAGDGFRTPDSLQNPAFLEFLDRLGMVPLFAHHPACKYYHNHIIWIGKVPLCLGCSMMACGIASGIWLLPHLGFMRVLPFSALLCLGVLLYIPAVFQVWIQFKPYKILARFLLGISVVFLGYAGTWLTPWSLGGWILKVGFLAVFYTVWNLTLAIRSQYSTSPCQHCPEGRFPVCSYTIPRIPRLANKYLSESDGTNPDADEFVIALQSVYGTKSVS